MSSTSVSAVPVAVLGSFPQFGKLPLELRLRIWELSFEEQPRIVLIREKRIGDEGAVNIESCVRHLESRRMAMRDIRKREVTRLLPNEFRIYLERSRQDYGDLLERGHGKLHLCCHNLDWGLGNIVPHMDGHYDAGVIELWLRAENGKTEAASQYNRIQSAGVEQIKTMSNAIPLHLDGGSETSNPDTSNPLIRPKWLLESTCRLPPSANTCRESVLAAKPRKNAFGGRKGVLSSIFFNFELDTLYLDFLTFMEKMVARGTTRHDPFIEHDLRNFDRNALAKVKYLALDWNIWFLSPWSLSWMLGYFPRVERLFLVVNDSVVDFDLSSLCFTNPKLVDSHIFDDVINVEGPFEAFCKRKKILDDKYQDSLPVNLLTEHLRQEMHIRLARTDRPWKLPKISLVNLSDRAIEDRISRSYEAYRKSADRVWPEMIGFLGA